MTCEGFITSKDIEAIRKSTKIGSKIKLKTLKTSGPESTTSSRCGYERKGEVIAKFPHHAVIRLENGSMESVTWTELITRRKKHKVQ